MLQNHWAPKHEAVNSQNEKMDQFHGSPKLLTANLESISG